MPDSPHELVAETVLARHSSPALTVELLWLGEGHHGDFDAADADDAPLVRFDAQQRHSDGNWRHLTSWCTSVDANSPRQLLDAAARHIHSRLTEALLTDTVRRVSIELAQLHADEPCLQQQLQPNGARLTTEPRTIGERAEHALHALEEATNALAEGNRTEASMRVDDADGIVREILELAPPAGAPLAISYAADGQAAVDGARLAGFLAEHPNLTLPDPDDFFIDDAGSAVAHFLSEAAREGVLQLPAGLQLTVIGDDDPNGPGLVLELAPPGVLWRVTTGWRELANFQPPRQNPYFDADPKPAPYPQITLAEQALTFACGEVNAILLAGRGGTLAAA